MRVRVRREVAEHRGGRGLRLLGRGGKERDERQMPARGEEDLCVARIDAQVGDGLYGALLHLVRVRVRVRVRVGVGGRVRVRVRVRVGVRVRGRGRVRVRVALLHRLVVVQQQARHARQRAWLG